MIVTRFAPSPTGPLHLGHAFSALMSQRIARSGGGTFLLRIEDIDQSRARAEWETQIFDDLHWLGLQWPEPVMRQSERLQIYRDALQSLWDMGLLYPCQCSRRDIAEALSAPQECAEPKVSGPTVGPDGPVYPGTCRPLRPPTGTIPTDLPLRLNMARAVAQQDACFDECGHGPEGQTGTIRIPPDHMIHAIGDVVLARRDMGTSYHLSVVCDDAAQQVSDVVRGQDLFEATAIHVLLQRLLGHPTPRYHHHRLIRDAAGKRLAKRDDARAIATYRAEGARPDDLRAMVGL
ncbi:tRNA glutamyl-Q(34) synthetase GluQRS [Pseudooceanicola sediminis]|uniref:tRNA glutamyl-Q(34) synthetase GluQRS n=1 Tax=Pseudooceanicola sediminis TaxID=2211117 RepID=A0A399J5A3_9RHOB|nr:tRNA glutamyl-Q(34) synthetase GluQRS [Pseudooceanicola sediminis]RII40663.1 tRNA glutamyl-Q(34) synthetase GluQRS [Pseudooceanicola sediminis]